MRSLILSIFLIQSSLLLGQDTSWKRDSVLTTSSLTDSVHKVINRFEKQIIHFQKEDSIQPNKGNELVLFVGSSSIRLWKNLSSDFAGLNVLNRGFGGSTFIELNYYFRQLVSQYNPSKIVVYCGENDMTLSYSLPEDVLRSFITFEQLCKLYLPQAKVYYVSIKPSPRSWYYWPKIQEANRYVENYIKQDKFRLKYIEIKTTLLDDNNVVRKELFLKDGIHMKSEVYPSWAKIIRKSLND